MKKLLLSLALLIGGVSTMHGILGVRRRSGRRGRRRHYRDHDRDNGRTAAIATTGVLATGALLGAAARETDTYRQDVREEVTQRAEGVAQSVELRFQAIERQLKSLEGCCNRRRQAPFQGE